MLRESLHHLCTQTLHTCLPGPLTRIGIELHAETRLAAAKGPQLEAPLDYFGRHILAQMSAPFEGHHHLIHRDGPPRFPLGLPHKVQAIDEGAHFEQLVVARLPRRDVVGVVVEVKSPEELPEPRPAP